jgi:adenine-specific DNA-methyltransferase
VFAKSKEDFKPNLLPRTKEMDKRYSNPDNDARGPWKPGGFSVKTYSKEYDYPIETPSGKIVYPPKGSCWQTSKDNYLKKLKDNRIWFGPNKDSKPQLKQFLSEVQRGVVCKSIWTYDEVGHNQVSRSEIVNLFGEFVFSTPKPEKLLKRIIELSTELGDIVLDYNLGSGTTCAVAHKISRQYIGIEQMNYIKTVTVERLQKVMKGDQIGISKEVGWQGGGDFVYLELAEWNENFVKKIQKAKTKEKLKQLWETMKEKAFLSYKVNVKAIDENAKDFKDLSIENQKRFLLECLDKNHLYVNYSEIDDEEYRISKEDKKLNKEFYG